MPTAAKPPAGPARKSATPFLYFAMLAFCSVLASVLLFAFSMFNGFLGDSLRFGSGMDTAFYVQAVLTAGGHVLAFLLSVQLFVNRARPKHIIEAVPAAVILACVVAVQLFWRRSSIPLTHIDCYTACSNLVVPWNLDVLISWITAGALAVALVFMVWRIKRAERT